MSAFTPNFENKATRRRCEQALAWVEQFVSPHKANWLSTREIDRHFTGGSNPISRWLRQQLLIVEDPTYLFGSKKQCKTYRRNQDGFEKLYAALYGTTQEPNPKGISPQLEHQLDTGEFEYKEQSDRLWNPLQNIPKTVKKPLMADRGYRYHYDIRSAAPRLISQYSQQLGMTQPIPYIERYLNDCDQMRQEIATRCNLSQTQVKKIINAILNGAPISVQWDASIYLICDKNKQSVELLKQDQDIQGLKEDFKKCWTKIKETLPKEPYVTKSGVEKTKPLNSRRKSQIYRGIELQVIKEVKRYLKKKKNLCLLEHDGWFCKEIIDQYELRTSIKNKLGYHLEFECSIYEYV